MEETSFGRYRLIELLGRGGMGEVWRAFDTETQRVVAVKVLPANLVDDPTFEERFRREALAAAGLTDPHVVPIHNFGEIEGRLYVDMRLITGRDLQAIIAEGPLAPERAVRIIEQIASALRDAHRIGLVHRDVKPSNILVTENDFAYLIDFGIARTAGETRVTNTGNVIGTWAYMAPERLTSDQIDPRADTYALACVLHECLTGSQPFPGDSLERQVGGHLGMPPPRPSTLRSGLPVQLDTVIATGMAKNPNERYTPVTAMAAAARAAISAPPTVPGPIHRNEPPQFETRWATPPPVPQNYYQPAQGGGVSPTDATQHRAANDYLVPPAGPVARGAPVGSQPNRKARRIALTSIAALVVVITVVVAIALTRGGGGDSAHPPVSQTTTAVPNTGPFTGTYNADFGPRLSLTGQESPGSKPPGGESWDLRSVCGGSGCVATASRVSGTFGHPTTLVFDDVGGRWIAVALGTAKCNNRDTEEWNFVWLKPRPDGTMAGEWISDSIDCYSKRAVTFTRTGDTDVARLTDPAGQAARVATAALGLRGVYHSKITFTGGVTRYKPQEDNSSVETVCLRAGDRCLSRFVRTDGSGRYELLIFANGAWTRNSEFDTACPAGGTSHVKISGVFPLPKPPQDPIPQISGHGHKEQSGSPCTTSDYEEVYDRSGD